MQRKLKIGIVGCGIGGLAAAALLAKQGHHVQLFDQFSAPAPVGSGLIIQPVGQAVLNAVGAGATAFSKGTAITHMLGHEASKGRRILDVRYDSSRPGRQGLAIHRASLFDALFNAAEAAGAKITSDARVVAAPQSKNSRQLRLDTGADHGPFDLVIDASGVHSLLSPLKARSLDYGAIWGTVDWPEVTGFSYDGLIQRYSRAAKMLGILPIGTLPGEDTRKAAIFWSLPHGGLDMWRQQKIGDWKQEAEQLWPEMAPFLSNITHHDQMTHASYKHGSLNRPFQERLAFIGDAAHCASPQLGQGANMALLDAYALSQALQKYPPTKALGVYARQRRWHVRVYQAFSWAFTPMYQSDSYILPLLRDWLLAPASQIPGVPLLLQKLVSGDLVSTGLQLNKPA